MPKKAKKKAVSKSAASKNYVVAKESDGTIQITFTVPFSEIKTEREKVVKEIAETAELPGFRKGKAPLGKVKENISENVLVEHTLSHILPKYLAQALREEKLSIAIYPKFQLVSSNEGEPWQVRAVTAEMPKIELGDYKKLITGQAAAGAIWTPGSGKDEKGKEKKELTREEKEQMVIGILLQNIKIVLPKVIIEEEVNTRLSNLLARIEKLGLSLDGYLASTGKTSEELRKEYEAQATEAISLDLILNKIAESEKVSVDKAETEPSLKQIKETTPKISEEDLASQKRILEGIIRKRKVLDSLTSLVA